MKNRTQPGIQHMKYKGLMLKSPGAEVEWDDTETAVRQWQKERWG
jgi:hypothetical protein